MVRRSARGRVDFPSSLLFSNASLNEDSFTNAWEFLTHYRRRFPAPVRLQSETHNCVKFAAWTALECLVGKTDPPSFMTRVKDDKKGMMMATLYCRDAVVREFASSGIVFQYHEVRSGNKLNFLKTQMIDGETVAVLGLRLSMFDEPNTHVRRNGLKRGGPPR